MDFPASLIISDFYYYSDTSMQVPFLALIISDFKPSSQVTDSMDKIVNSPDNLKLSNIRTYILYKSELVAVI